MRLALLGGMLACLMAWGVTKAATCVQTHVHGVSQSMVQAMNR